jgi:hypothetical protein
MPIRCCSRPARNNGKRAPVESALPSIMPAINVAGSSSRLRIEASTESQDYAVDASIIDRGPKRV